MQQTAVLTICLACLADHMQLKVLVALLMFSNSMLHNTRVIQKQAKFKTFFSLVAF